MRNGKLSSSNRVNEIDVKALESVTANTVFGLLRSRWAPESGPCRLKYAGAGTDNVESGEMIHCSLEEVVKVGPGGYISLLEDRFGTVRVLGVLIDQLLGFWPKGEVADEDIGAVLEEDASELEVDACLVLSKSRKLQRRYGPLPAPVTIAVLPLTDRDIFVVHKQKVLLRIWNAKIDSQDLCELQQQESGWHDRKLGINRILEQDREE